MSDVCDIAYALMLERVEQDARAHYAGVELEGTTDPFDEARDRLDDYLASAADGRRAGISDEVWELRRGLGVA